MKHRS